MKKRWISLFVENEVGTLARISGLFSGKAYNLDSLTVGVTEDPTVSRMTIGLTSDDRTFEQIKRQLDRSVEVIQVLDLTDAPMYARELMLLRVCRRSPQELAELEHLEAAFPVRTVERGSGDLLLESVQTEAENDALLRLLSGRFSGRLEIVRGGGVAIGTAD